MATESIPLLVIGTIFLSTLVRAAFGFGDALVAMPLLAMAVGVRVATPLAALTASTIAITLAIGGSEGGGKMPPGRLVVPAIIGIPFGIFFLGHVPEAVAQALLGVILFLFAIHRLSGKDGMRLGSERSAPAFGFLSGVLGGAYNTNGPPIVVYAALRGWAPEDYRTTLQGSFLPTGLAITASHAIAGMWGSEVFRLYLYCLPAIFIAIAMGRRIGRAIPEGRFERYIWGLLLVTGGYLLYRAVTAMT